MLAEQKRDSKVAEYHLAQLNIVKMKFDIEAPELEDFTLPQPEDIRRAIEELAAW